MIDPVAKTAMRIAEARNAAAELAEKINRGAGGREVALAITKLEEAALWLSQASIRISEN